MKNKSEIFIKYLDNELSPEEKKIFEKKLLDDETFKTEFNLFKENFNSLKISKIDVNENYFNSLLPEARKKIGQTKHTNFIKFAYLLPVIIIGIILFKTIFNNNFNENNFEQLLNSYSTNEDAVVELIDNVYSSDQDFLIDNELLEQLYEIENINDESVYDYLAETVLTSDIEEYLINQLSEEEFNMVYNELLNKNFNNLEIK